MGAFFGNDTCRFQIHLSNYLHKNLKRYRAHVAEKDKNDAKQGEKKKKEVEKITTNMMTKSIASILGHDAFTKDVTSALEKDKDVDLLTLLKEDGKKKVEGSSLEEAKEFDELLSSVHCHHPSQEVMLLAMLLPRNHWLLLKQSNWQTLKKPETKSLSSKVKTEGTSVLFNMQQVVFLVFLIL